MRLLTHAPPPAASTLLLSFSFCFYLFLFKKYWAVGFRPPQREFVIGGEARGNKHSIMQRLICVACSFELLNKIS